MGEGTRTYFQTFRIVSRPFVTIVLKRAAPKSSWLHRSLSSGWGTRAVGVDVDRASARLPTEEVLADMIDGMMGLSLGDTSRFLVQGGRVRSSDVYEGEGSLRQSE